jgi:glycosyltransferase involved in cell wall biosynthesis
MIVMNSGDFDNTKIFVTGIPFNATQLQEKYPFESKENIVVFPHRCNEEKHPENFDKLKKKYPQWKFIKTLEETTTREEYFQLLAKSKVMISFADQETWGFSTLESMALGNYVIVPNGLSYRETVPDKEYRYDKEKEVATMLEDFMSREELPIYTEIQTIGTDAISKMLKVLRVQLRATVKRREEEAQAVRDEQIRVAEERKAKQAERDAKKKAKTEETTEETKTAEQE